ncbi:hypothetical protein CHS0354_022799 [Potamilus streckersoni]|uniref:Uncharacterized protein n=1 Tax=Potamilus streckersoni TaxID=2493646 RepID=A0AAE0S2A1_9BIVA|nr:hypothetical protein CHS0354_022799 [Potamilus streckersoni]
MCIVAVLSVTFILKQIDEKHSLGADHDGENSATACKAEDFFIMGPKVKQIDPSETYTKNPWLFSNCSVESFKKTLAKKYVQTEETNRMINCISRGCIFVKMTGVISCSGREQFLAAIYGS